MPSSPQKPQQRRTSSTDSVNLDLRRGVPGNSIQGHRKASIGRSSPNPEILLLSGREDDSFSADRSHVADEFGGFQERTNGLGNLAEELADVWDEDGERDPAQSPCGEQVHSAAALPTVASRLAGGNDESIALSDTAHDSSGSQYQESGLRPASLDGDGSDAEDASLFSATLEAGMTAVDNLVRQESDTDGTALDDVVCRLADALRALPSQSGIENGTSRFDFHVPFAAFLIATHAALTAHLSHQARALQALSHFLISPLATSPEPEVIDGILPLLTALILAVPTQRAPCLLSLHSLRASTTDLQAFLNYLTDTIYMTRQTITSATRRLRMATDVVEDLRRESQAQDEAVKWIEKGAWDSRLNARECQKVCGDVIGGFEEVCQSWRARLMDGLVTA